MMAQILGFIAQTAGDPALTKLLTEEMLKIADIPEAKEIAQKMDTIQQLQSQVEQLSQQLQEAQGQVKAATNQAAQKEIAAGTQQAVAQAKTKVDVEAARSQQQIKDETADALEDDTMELPEEDI